MKSGFVALVGRPNVGKSTLVNQVVGTKVSIVSNKVQTTRMAVRGILNREDAQVVFVDTPGIHKPRTLLGERLNETGTEALAGVDVAVLVIDATAPFGAGDEYVSSRLPKNSLVVVNKTDRASKAQVLEQLQVTSRLGMRDYFPVSARTGEGVDDFVQALVELLPEGPQYYERTVVADVPEAVWVAELVREQFLHLLREEMPHSLATRVTEWEWPRVRCEVIVERESQKPIVIGKDGSVLKQVGIRAREQIDDKMFLELFVKVDKGWQRNSDALNRLGY